MDSATDSNRQGLGLAHAGRYADAAACFRRAVELEPSHAEAQNNLGAALLALEQFEPAVPALEAAVRLQPGNADAHFNLGVASWKTGRTEQSIAHFAQVAALRPDFADAWHNLGILLTGIGRFEEAVQGFSQAVALRPGFADAHTNLGMALVAVRRNEEAIAVLTRAVELDPSNALARTQRMYLLAAICDWDALQGELPMVPELGVTTRAVPPFGMLAFEDEPYRHLVRAQRFTAEKYRAEPVPIASPSARPAKLKIGYFSADFREHAVMQVAAPLFENHDRARFSIHAFAYGPPTDDPMRRRLVETFDRFYDVAAMPDADIAARARDEGIDIAVDLMGHTLHSRLGMFAHRTAPIQVTHLGFPGSTGAPFMDYLVADATVVPDDTRGAFSERLIVLPDSYQPNGRRPIAATRWTRAKADLPDAGFVFCNFNNSFKITPREWAIWMGLLHQVEGSVLWLVAQNPHVERNLAAQAARRGIDPARLVFAPRVALDEYLARQPLADLALDSLVYNGHATGSDALWAGVPMVTRLGQGFATRVGASLLRAVGLPELVTESDGDYAKLALALATDPEWLAAIRKRLAEALPVSPLYDAALYARYLEAGFDAAFDRLVKGEPPADIVVPT